MEDDRSRYLHPPESDFLQPDDAAASLSSGLGSSSASAAAGAPQRRSPYPGRKRRWAVILYFLTTTLLFADQNLLAPNLSAAAAEFGFDDEERDRKLGGNIALAFWVLGAPASFIIGSLADVLPRAPLFALTVGLGEGACFATYFTTTYRQLYVTRALTGISVGGALPLISSVLGDLYEAKDRPAVMAAVGIGMGTGISVGQGLAGFLGPTYGWRLPFLLVSTPALICALLVLLTVQDPERGGSEEAYLRGDVPFELDSVAVADAEAAGTADSDESGLEDWSYSSPNRLRANLQTRDQDGMESRSSIQIIRPTVRSRCSAMISTLLDWRLWQAQLVTLRVILSSPSVVLVMLQGAPGCLPWGVINSFLNDYLHSDRGMTVERATTVLLLFGVGNFIGMVVGGATGSILYRRSARLPPLFGGAMAIIGCAPMWLMINRVYDTSPMALVALISLSAGLCSGVTGPIVKATLQNLTLPNNRGQAFALQNTFDDFGRGLGPVFVAILISSLGGRTIAFNVSVVGWVLCGIFNMLLYFTVEKDEGIVQRRFADALQLSSPSGRSLTEGDADPLLPCTKRREAHFLSGHSSMT